MAKRSDNYWAAFSILVDEVRYAYLDVYGSNIDRVPAGSATINIELMSGQVVRIENVGSAWIYGTDSNVISSWFTGHLLYAL